VKERKPSQRRRAAKAGAESAPPASRQPKSSGRSLATSSAFRDFIVDQLSELGDVTARSMFGGIGLYCGALFFGILARNVLYLKVDEGNRADYERSGMKPFTPYPDRPGTMQYYEVPVGAIESAPDLVRWARKSVEAAKRAQASRARKR